MVSISYPSPAYNAGTVTDLEFERLSASQAPDGLIGYPTDPALVYANGSGTRVVRIRPNRRGLVRGFEYDSGPSELTLTLAANTSGVTRVDLIVLRLDRATWTVKEAVVQGTPGSGAPSPTQNTGSIGVWELPLAEVTVTNGATTLSAGTVVPVAWYLGDDGQILCTDETRPPTAEGRMFTEVDTDRTWHGNPLRLLVTPVTVSSRSARDSFPNKYEGLPFWRSDLDRLDVYTGSGWRIFARPSSAVVPNTQSTASTGYTNLATVGPTVTVETGDAAEVVLSAQTIGPGASFVLMSFQVSGATSIAPSDLMALAQNGNIWILHEVTFLVTGLNPGSNTFQAKYRMQTGTGTWAWRRLTVRPV